MGKISDLTFYISELLDSGVEAAEIARVLEIPVNWVFEQIEINREFDEVGA